MRLEDIKKNIFELQVYDDGMGGYNFTDEDFDDNSEWVNLDDAKSLESQLEKVTKENFLNEALTVSQQKDINTLLSQVEGLRKEIALIANDQLKSPYKRIELIRKSLKKKV